MITLISFLISRYQSINNSYFQARNANIALDNDFVTTPELQERYKLLSENSSNKSVIQKREINQRKSIIELAIFTDRLEDKNVDSASYHVQFIIVGHFINMWSNVIQMYTRKTKSRKF